MRKLNLKKVRTHRKTLNQFFGEEKKGEKEKKRRDNKRSVYTEEAQIEMKRSKGTFLSDDCGQNALQLAARGSAIIAELLRLSEHIPTVFKHPEASPQYAKIICDFRYFQFQDKFEKDITDSAELLQRDEEFRSTHMELLDRFFKLFRGVYGYVLELNRFVEEIKEGLYLSQTLESVLTDNEGKQLLCEIYYLYGVMLLLLDYKVGSHVREYLIVSYIRYRGAGEQYTVEITQMCANTGFVYDQKLPPSYPVHYFDRVKVDKVVVGLLIGRIRSDDIYQSSYNYPTPEHRSTALANQAAILYILLFFRPEILHEEGPVMREIVDKHFADNWVINYYMGFTVDLVVAWHSFKAASNAIAGTIAKETVSYHQSRMKACLAACNNDIAGFLREGVLTEQYVLDNIHATLLPSIRDANVTLRWFILHMTRGQSGRRFFENFRKSYEQVTAGVSTDDIITLLLQTAQLEFTLKAMFTQFLKEKKGKWEAAKEEGTKKMSKLAQYFSGEHVLSDNVRIEQLESWFNEISSRIDSLEYHDSTTANRKIQKLMKALENVQEFHQIDNNLQVVQFLQDTRFLMRQMIRYINIERKVLITMSTIGDLSYAWELFSNHECFVPEIQQKIKNNPTLVIQMRSAFVKLASVVELPCTRIDQAAVNDTALMTSLESVSEYYSGELVVYVRKVLQIIPTSIFAVLKEIIELLLRDVKDCPTKLGKSELKQQSQLVTRQRLASHTSDIAKFAHGILAMESTLVGVIQVDPHKLLEDGIRKELIQQICGELHKALQFEPKKIPTAEDVDSSLQQLARQLQGMRQAFEYVQDYVNVHGPRIWLEEYSRIVNFNVEMECNSFMKKKLYHWQSKYQSDSIPIPYYERKNEREPYSFLGRVVQVLLILTNPTKVMYVPALGSWFDIATAREAVGGCTFNNILSAFGNQGLAALDRLLCFIVAKDLQILVSKLKHSLEPHTDLFKKVRADLTPVSAIPIVAAKHYMNLDHVLSRLFTELSDILVRIGRIQLLRRHINNEQRSSCKLNSAALFCVLDTANTALLADLDRHYSDPSGHVMPGEIIPQISPFLDASGMCHPQSKVYTTSKPLPELCFTLVALVVRNVARCMFDDGLCCLLPKRREEGFDAAPFAFGTMLLLKQFHSEQQDLFFGHLTQYIRVAVCEFEAADSKRKDVEIVPEHAFVLSKMMELLAFAGDVSVEEFHRMIPPVLLGEPHPLPSKK